jgi:hypothetical protein
LIFGQHCPDLSRKLTEKLWKRALFLRLPFILFNDLFFCCRYFWGLLEKKSHQDLVSQSTPVNEQYQGFKQNPFYLLSIKKLLLFILFYEKNISKESRVLNFLNFAFVALFQLQKKRERAQLVLFTFHFMCFFL